MHSCVADRDHWRIVRWTCWLPVPAKSLNLRRTGIYSPKADPLGWGGRASEISRGPMGGARKRVTRCRQILVACVLAPLTSWNGAQTGGRLPPQVRAIFPCIRTRFANARRSAALNGSVRPFFAALEMKNNGGNEPLGKAWASALFLVVHNSHIRLQLLSWASCSWINRPE